MPSTPALEIANASKLAIGRQLTREELLSCEELAINVYPNAIIRYIKLARVKNGDFGYIFAPIFNGIIIGAKRRERNDRFRFSTQGSRDVYYILDSYLGSGYSLNELDEVVWLSLHATLTEIRLAIEAAKKTGIIHAAYIKAIILGNRRRATQRLEMTRRPKITNGLDLPTGVPDVKGLQDKWTRKLKSAVEDRTGEDAARHGQTKV